MRRVHIPVILGILLLLNPIPSEAGFSVKLKNGRTLHTETYKAEGDQVILYLESGAVKFPRSEIHSIVQDSRETEGRKADQEEAKRNIVKEPPGGQTDVAQYKKRKKEIQERLDESKRVYFNATNKNEKDEARKVMLSISKEMFDLQQEVTEKNNGTVPEWWQE